MTRRLIRTNAVAGRVGVVALVRGRWCCRRAAAARRRRTAPTFTKDVAPIFQEKCEACHRPDSIAPMSLVTYAEARPWARSIKARVAEHQMPPWHIDKTVGIQKFKNDRSLTDEQIDDHRRSGSTPARRRATRRTCRRREPGPRTRAGTSPRCSARRSPT